MDSKPRYGRTTKNLQLTHFEEAWNSYWTKNTFTRTQLVRGLPQHLISHTPRVYTTHRDYKLRENARSRWPIEARVPAGKSEVVRRDDLDGIAFDGETFVVELGIRQYGHKTVLGLRQGATENATAVGELYPELEQRGVDFQEPRLYVLDGAILERW